MIDSKSVKNTDTARDKGYDAGKKVSGIKRHIIVDTEGLPHGILVTTADKTDRQGEPYRVCRRVNILRDYPDDKIKIYP